MPEASPSLKLWQLKMSPGITKHSLTGQITHSWDLLRKTSFKIWTYYSQVPGIQAQLIIARMLGFFNLFILCFSYIEKKISKRNKIDKKKEWRSLHCRWNHCLERPYTVSNAWSRTNCTMLSAQHSWKYTLEDHRWWPRYLGPSHPHGRPKWSS